MATDYTGLCLLIFIVSIGFLMISYGGWQFLYYYRGRWQPARGRVLESRPAWCGGEGSGEAALFQPYVRFVYSHGGVERESEQFYPMGSETTGTFREMQFFLRRYKDGADIGIFINSADGNAVVVLDKANRSRDHFLNVVLAGVGLWGFGVLVLWVLHSRGWH